MRRRSRVLVVTLSGLLGGVLVIAVAFGVEFLRSRPASGGAGTDACVVYAKVRARLHGGGAVATPAVEPELKRALQLAERAADHDAEWRSLATALRDVLAAADTSTRDAADERAWRICQPWVGT